MLTIGKFSPYTEILTEAGPKQIRSLIGQEGLRVWTMNEHTEKPELKKLLRVLMPVRQEEMYRVITGGDCVTMPADGLIWTADGWHDLGCFQRGRAIKMLLPGREPWESGTRGVVPAGRDDVMGLSLEEGATNIITCYGVVVHL